MKIFQIIKQNTDGTIVIEFPLYHNKTIDHPRDSTGTLLSGLNLIQYINVIISAEQSIQPPLETPDYESSLAFQTQFELTEAPGDILFPGGIPV